MAVSARLRQLTEASPGASAYDEESFRQILELGYQGNVLTETGTNGRIRDKERERPSLQATQYVIPATELRPLNGHQQV
jgi:hypothetical protein